MTNYEEVKNYEMGLLITDIKTELKKYVPVSQELNIEEIAPDLDHATRQNLMPVLSKAQYALLLDKYEADAITAGSVDEELLFLCQAVISNFALSRYVVAGQIQIDSAAVGRAGSGKAAWQWQIDDIAMYFSEKGFSAEDELLAFLEDNKATYTAWVSSSSYTQTKQFFVNDATTFNNYVNIGASRKTYLAMWPSIRKVEEFEIERVLGVAFYDTLKEQIALSALDGDNQKLMRYLVPAVAHLSAAKAIIDIPVQIKGDAILISATKATGDNYREKTKPSDNLLSAKMRQLQTDGEAYLGKLLKYLNENASEVMYAEFFNSAQYVAVGAASVTFKNDKNNGYYAAL